MLTREILRSTDPFRELDRLTRQFLAPQGPTSRPAVMPMDAYRTGDEFVVHFDLPGVAPESIDLDVRRQVLTIKAERSSIMDKDQELQVAERPRGVFSRQLFLSDTLDVDQIQADYQDGVLTLRIPVAQQAKPRKIVVSGADGKQINT